VADKHNYFGDSPFSGEDYTDLANSVKRIVDKKPIGFKYTKEQIRDMSEQNANKSVQDTYKSMITSNRTPNKIVKPGEEDK
jgi:vacuolar-type H+-ATPase subunit E/Vma4